MSTRLRPTSGFTFVELLVVVVLGAMILGAAYQVLAVQERSYRQQGAAMTTQQTMRGTLEVLEAELREISASDGDLIAISPNSMVFRAYRATGFVCWPDGPGFRVEVREVGEPFRTIWSGNDAVLIFEENNPDIMSDDRWLVANIQNIGPPSNGCGDRMINVGGITLNGVRTGALVRQFVPFTYELRQINGEWVLARQGPNDGSPVPLIGPLAPSPNGLVFSYFDENGAATTNPAQVASIQIVIRGRTQGTGVPGQTHYTDSLVTQLYLRNN